MTGTTKGTKSQSEVVYYLFPSLSGTKKQQVRIWPISLMITSLSFPCTCTVMDDPKSSTCHSKVPGSFFCLNISEKSDSHLGLHITGVLRADNESSLGGSRLVLSEICKPQWTSG